MARLVWDQTGARVYETGDKQVALFVQNTDGTYKKGVAWNGITAITETPSGAEATDLWADDTKYATMRSAEQFGGTIEAYTYPDEFEQCDGTAHVTGVAGLSIGQQARRSFGLAYITTVGNDTELNDYGEKLHLVYGCTASPSERSYATINDSPEAITFSWEFETTPVDVQGHPELKKTSIITIDKKKLGNNDLYENLKKKIYGDGTTAGTNDPTLLLPHEVIEFLGAALPAYTYVALASDPSSGHWDEVYINYFEKISSDPDEYQQLTRQATAPTFVANKYYERQLDTD